MRSGFPETCAVRQQKWESQYERNAFGTCQQRSPMACRPGFGRVAAWLRTNEAPQGYAHTPLARQGLGACNAVGCGFVLLDTGPHAQHLGMRLFSHSFAQHFRDRSVGPRNLLSAHWQLLPAPRHHEGRFLGRAGNCWWLHFETRKIDVRGLSWPTFCSLTNRGHAIRNDRVNACAFHGFGARAGRYGRRCGGSPGGCSGRACRGGDWRSPQPDPFRSRPNRPRRNSGTARCEPSRQQRSLRGLHSLLHHRALCYVRWTALASKFYRQPGSRRNCPMGKCKWWCAARICRACH